MEFAPQEEVHEEDLSHGVTDVKQFNKHVDCIQVVALLTTTLRTQEPLDDVGTAPFTAVTFGVSARHEPAGPEVDQSSFI